MTLRAAPDYLSMELCEDVLRAIAHQAKITRNTGLQRRSGQAKEMWKVLLSNVLS